jgi:ribosome recycling factor
MADTEAIKAAQGRMDKTIAAHKDEFKAIRTGRAAPALLDTVVVNYYDQKTPLSQVATVSAPEARLLVVQPFEKAMLTEIEREIQKADLGLNPGNDGKVIRISIPPLTADRRKDLSKQAKGIAENSRVSIRNIRRDVMEDLKKKQKDSKLTEDELKATETELQKATDNYIADIGSILDAKDKEITEG